jgi:hypothetical protein
VRLVRAFNVLRQYEASDVRPAYDQIMAQVLPGGLLLDIADVLRNVILPGIMELISLMQVARI